MNTTTMTPKQASTLEREGKRVVTLFAYHHRNWSPNHKRWESVGWPVQRCEQLRDGRVFDVVPV